MKNIFELVNDLYIDPNYIKWKQYHEEENIWNILGKADDELSHSKFLSYLFDPTKNETIDNYAIEQLLKMLVLCNIRSGNKNNTLTKYQTEILSGATAIVVENNVCEKADRNARYDIFIELLLNNEPITLIIENKVNSTENVGQTKKYSTYSSDYNNPILVYLDVVNPEVDESFITITYQQLLDNVIEPTYNIITDDKTKTMVKDYIRILSNAKLKKGVNNMAISKEEKDLLKNIYNNNQELITKMFEAISGELDGEEKKALETLNNYTVSRKTKWIYNGEVVSSKELVRRIVKDQLQKGQSIETMSKYKMHSAPLVVSSIEPDEDRYESLKLNDGTIVYVRNCCDRKDVEVLIDTFNIDAKQVVE